MSSSSSSELSFMRLPRSNPNMEEETYTREQLDECIERLNDNLLSSIGDPQITNQLKEMLVFLNIYMDETSEFYIEFHTEDDYPFPFEYFNNDIFGVNPKRMLDQVYDDDYDKFGKKIKDIIYTELIIYFYGNNDDNNSINENPQVMGGNRNELNEAIKTTTAWRLYVLNKYRENKKGSNKGSNKGSKKGLKKWSKKWSKKGSNKGGKNNKTMKKTIRRQNKNGY
jgi:hypothetical protein